MSEITKQAVSAWLAESLRAAPKSENFADINAATTMANFLGNNTADPGATGKNVYSDPNNLPTAVASILNRAQSMANFHPASQTPEEVARQYGEYIRQIDRIPFLHLLRNDQVKQTYSSSNYNVLIDNIVSIYDGVSQQDRDKIKNSISNLAKSVFTQSMSEIWNNLFSQATINYNSPNDVRIYIYYTTLHMRHEDKGKSGVSDFQEYTVNRTEYRILNEMIITYAEQLARLDKRNVDDWTNESTTPEKQGYKLCFNVDPYTEPATL